MEIINVRELNAALEKVLNAIVAEKEHKTYHFQLEERCGEKEYTYDFLLIAKDEKEAWEYAKDYASRFYGEDEDGNPEGELVEFACTRKGETTYEFNGGEIWVSISYLQETTMVNFIKNLLLRYTLYSGKL